MKEIDIVKSTKYPNTLKSIYENIKALGVNEGDTVIVHSSLSKIGWVCGEEVTIVDALLKCVGENGTIVMPSHTGGNSNPEEWSNPAIPKEWFEEIINSMPAFNKDITPSRCMGRIPEVFRKYPGTIRSDHPQSSFCANGKNKFNIINDHVLTPSFGMKTPLGKLYNMNAKILLLGVSYSNCTMIHLAETLIPKSLKIKKGAAIEKGSKREWIWFDDVDYNSDDFEKIGEAYEKEIGIIKQGFIGNATCKIIESKSLVDYSKNWMIENRI